MINDETDTSLRYYLRRLMPAHGCPCRQSDHPDRGPQLHQHPRCLQRSPGRSIRPCPRFSPSSSCTPQHPSAPINSPDQPPLPFAAYPSMGCQRHQALRTSQRTPPLNNLRPSCSLRVRHVMCRLSRPCGPVRRGNRHCCSDRSCLRSRRVESRLGATPSPVQYASVIGNGNTVLHMLCYPLFIKEFV